MPSDTCISISELDASADLLAPASSCRRPQSHARADASSHGRITQSRPFRQPAPRPFHGKSAYALRSVHQIGRRLSRRLVRRRLIKALYGFDAVVGNYASPYSPGTAYVLLHHAIGEMNGKKRVWGHAIGGMGAITQAMARPRPRPASRSRPARRSARWWSKRAGHPAWCSRMGAVVRGKAVAANVNPKLLYTRHGSGGRGRCGFSAPHAGWRCGSGTFRMNFALAELPSFAALPGHDASGSSHRRHHPCAEPRYMDRAYCDARTAGWSREPIIELVIASTLDDTLAPRERMSRACSASMWRHSCRMDAHGTISRGRLPI